MKLKFSLCIGMTAALIAVPVVFAADASKKKEAAAPAQQEAAAAAPAEKPAAPAAPLPDTVAVVEGTEIKKEELERAFNGLLAAQGIPTGQLPDEQKTQGYRMILDDMIIEKLIAKRSVDVKVPDEEVAATFDRIKANFASEEELKEQVEKSGQTIDKVKEEIRSSLRQQRWVEEQVKGKVEVNEAEAEKFYTQNPDQFKRPEQVRASHILIKVPEDAKPEVVIEKEKQAKAVAERVKKGEPFDKVAKEVSEDPSAKENSGDLDFFSKEQMVPEFSTAAFGMKKDEISEPVRSQFGYHIIKLTDRKAPETVTLEQAKPQLLTYLRQQKKQEEITKLVREIREKADVKVNFGK